MARVTGHLKLVCASAEEYDKAFADLTGDGSPTTKNVTGDAQTRTIDYDIDSGEVDLLPNE